jgi:hypothetical protein
VLLLLDRHRGSWIWHQDSSDPMKITVLNMNMMRFVAVMTCGLALAGCASMPGWMQLDLPRAEPIATTMQFESEPAGADAKTSAGQSCRTPCSLAVTSREFTVSFSLLGYQPQTVPVRSVVSSEARDQTNDGEPAVARLVPNPVFVELQPAAPSPPPRKPPVRQQPKPASNPAPTAMAPTQPAAPAPASPWPPAR